MDKREESTVRYEKLNLLGKAVFLGGAAVRMTANLIDTVIERAADVIVESERAFKQGRDPNVEDAKVLEEYDEARRPRRDERS